MQSNCGKRGFAHRFSNLLNSNRLLLVADDEEVQLNLDHANFEPGSVLNPVLTVVMETGAKVGVRRRP